MAEIESKRKRVDTTEDPKSSADHPLWKTSLCSYFRRNNGSCSHGDTCRYAHGEEELRQKIDGTWDPTSERTKKFVKIDENGEKGAVFEGFDDVLMTDAIADDCSDPALAKCLVNLPMKWDSDSLRFFLEEQGIVYTSAKKKNGMVVGFVNFENTDHVKRAVEELDGRSFGNKNLKVVDVVPRSFERKTKSTMPCGNVEFSVSSSAIEDADSIDDSLASNGSALKARSARDVVTPLAYMPYVDQLEQKKNSVAQTLKRLTRNARKGCPYGVSLPEWILKSREIGGLPCKLEGIIESPLVNGYRNKCEFSVGYSVHGKPTVGFMLGSFREGVTAVEEPVDCPNVSSISCKYAAIFQEFLEHSGLPIWNRLNNTGFWRQLTVREGRVPSKAAEAEKFEANISEVMIMVQVSSAGFEDEVVNNELEKMAQAFTVGASTVSPPLPLTALVLQDHTGISNVAPADAPLRSLVPKAEGDSGVVEARMHDYISNLRFCISPTAFFQINTLAAEKLYSLAGDWAGLGPDTLLFDICCGTGTIGLTLAHRVGMVIGVEMNASAVSDAQRNAEINGIKNCRFVCGKAENVIGSLLKEYPNSPQKHHEISDNGSTIPQFRNVVAIVDPPRGGLHPTVIKVLRTHPRLKRLVYISCNPESLVANAIELCTPSNAKTEKGHNNNRGWRNMGSAGMARHRAKSMPNSEPFQPMKAMAVDLFPHTPHCELVMLLER